MDEEKVRFSFWKRIEASSELLHAGEIIEPESVLLGSRLFITGKSISGQILEMTEFQLGDIKVDSKVWTSHPVQGEHPTTDNSSIIYLLSIPENSDFRYQVIEYSLETNTKITLNTTGIAPKQRKAPLSIVYYSSAIYFFGGLQIYRGDATGSFIYKLDLESKEWNNIDYTGTFPATVPHAPMTGCRSGHSTSRVGSSIYIFGGTMIEDSLLNPECLTSSVFDSFNTNDLHEYDLIHDKWSKINYKTVACVIPTMSQHAMASSPQFMYVYYEDKIYRYDILNQTWHKLKKSLKSPRIKGQCTMQLVDKYLYLVGNTHDGPEVYRLNLEKAWLWVPGDSMVDYSVIDKQSFYNHQPTSDVLIKIGDNKIYAHRKVLCKFSNLLKRQLNKGIKTISISEFPAIVMQILVEQLYSDCTLELPREMSTLLQLFRASHWLDVEDLDNKCLKSLNVSASNLRYVVELVGDIPEVRTKCLEYVKNHLKEAALILAADQLSGLLK